MSITREVKGMPGRDGTGPMGLGAMRGRGFGFRYGCGGGLGRNFFAASTASRGQKELLTEEKEILKARLETVNKQLALEKSKKLNLTTSQ